MVSNPSAGIFLGVGGFTEILLHEIVSKLWPLFFGQHIQPKILQVVLLLPDCASGALKVAVDLALRSGNDGDAYEL
jgi:hypothetical protein